MTTKQKQTLASIWQIFRQYIKDNASIIIAFIGLSWQISAKLGPYAYNKVASTFDTIRVTNLVARQLERDFSKFKVETESINNRQDSSLIRLINASRSN